MYLLMAALGGVAIGALCVLVVSLILPQPLAFVVGCVLAFCLGYPWGAFAYRTWGDTSDVA